mgnify:CR=1 FL=1
MGRFLENDLTVPENSKFLGDVKYSTQVHCAWLLQYSR